MKLLIIAALLAASQAALNLSAETHLGMQNICSDLPNAAFMRQVKAEKKAEVLKHMAKVCQIYERKFLPGAGKTQKRSLLSGLSGLFGEDSKIGTLLKAAEALNKAKGVFDEIKKIAPSVHDHVKGGVKDVHDALQDILDDITLEALGNARSTTTRRPTTPKFL